MLLSLQPNRSALPCSAQIDVKSTDYHAAPLLSSLQSSPIVHLQSGDIRAMREIVIRGYNVMPILQNWASPKTQNQYKHKKQGQFCNECSELAFMNNQSDCHIILQRQ